MSFPRLNQKRPNARLEIAGIFLLIVLAVFYLVISWRKWCDPLIDFGDQLYTAWRLSNGAVLYRDVDLLYGPLSQYFNAALFRIFGPGIMILVTANLIVVCAIIVAIYFLCRHAWGPLAATVACAVFISIFAFSQYVHFGNLNYVTPYSHEATHGMLISLALCVILIRWIENMRLLETFLAGGLFGLTIVIKPEFILATGLITFAAGLLIWRRRTVATRLALVWMIGAILPTAVFTVYFASVMPWSGAISAAGRAWLNALSSPHTADLIQAEFLGIDRPWHHLLKHLVATTLACLVIAALGITGWLGDKITRVPAWLFASASAAVFASLSLAVGWTEIGRCLFGLVSIYAVVCVWSILRGKDDDGDFRLRFSRLLLAILAIALMTRMILNGRIYHYGFYQAALAGIIVPAIVVGELPYSLSLGMRGRSVLLVAFLALLIPGIGKLTKRSLNHYRWKTTSVGSGRDQFYAFDRRIDPTGDLVNDLSSAMRDHEGPSLLVLPEGEMINYLARRPNPIPHFFFFAGVTGGGREAAIVDQLKMHPPYWIIIISRDLGEYGIERYGEKSGSGQEILNWIDANYKHVTRIGGDPLDYREHGALLLRKYNYP